VNVITLRLIDHDTKLIAVKDFKHERLRSRIKNPEAKPRTKVEPLALC
jgi:hypothetical protein